MTTPFDIVSQGSVVQAAGKPEVLRVVRELEHQALQAQLHAAFGVLQDARLVTPTTHRVWARLALAAPEAALFARDLHGATAPGVRCVPLLDDDPLADQWCAVFDGNQPAALVAADLPYEHWDGDRTFAYAVSREPDTVRRCAEALRARVTTSGARP